MNCLNPQESNTIGVKKMNKLELDEELVKYYIGLTTKAFEKATPIVEKGSEDEKKLNSMLKMASDYLEDAKYFLEKGVQG